MTNKLEIDRELAERLISDSADAAGAGEVIVQRADWEELRALLAQAEMWNPHPAEAHLASLLIVLGSAGIKVAGGTHGDPWTVAAPVVERQETVPKHKFDTLVQHCKRLDVEIAQARAHVNEITLYQQNAVWFWQHDGEDYLKSLSCPIIIQPHHLRELLEGKAQHNPMAEQTAPVSHQEPIAYMRNENTPNNLVKCTFTCPGAFGVYRQPPAPVAVVLPSEDSGTYDYGSYSEGRKHGWNACLDKVKELFQ